MRRVIQTSVAVGWATVLLVGPPAGLVRLGAVPWRAHLPDRQALTGWLAQPATRGFAVATLAAAGWLLWAVLLALVLAEASRQVARLPVRIARRALGHLRLPGPVQGLSAAVLGTVAVTTATTGPAAAASTHHSVAATAVPTGRATAGDLAPATTGPPPTPLTGPAGRRHHTHTVQRHDTLWDIAAARLGDPTRWPEIYQLNRDRYDRHGRMNHGDHIEPGWVLALPDDATPPAGAAPAPRPAPAHTDPADAPGDAPPPAAPPAPQLTRAPTTPGATPPPSTPAARASASSPSPGTPPRTGPSPSAPAPPGTTGSADRQAPPQTRRGVGVELPGGWIPIPLATAVLAAAAMVWLRRRRRYLPRPLTGSINQTVNPTVDDPDLRPLPPVINEVRRAVRHQAPRLRHPPAPAAPTAAADRPDSATGRGAGQPPVGAAGPVLAGLGPRIPLGGLGLVGPGAPSAARALLVAALSPGSPADPDAHGQVVIPADTLTALLGADAAHDAAIPRLQVTADLSDALARIDELLIGRRRLLDDHDAADPAGLPAADPNRPPMPPVLLLCHPPPTQLRARLTATLRLGAPLRISAVLLGDWTPRDTLTVQANGHTSGASGDRLAVLDTPTTAQLLHVLSEAHSGPPAATPPDHTPPATDPATPPPPIGNPTRTLADTTGAPTTDGPAADGPANSSAPPPGGPGQPAPDPPAGAQPDTAPAGAAPGVPGPTAATPHSGAAAPPARQSTRPPRRPVPIRLLGEPTILDRHGNPVPGLRHHARELLVYLAVHRTGANLSDIMEAFWPTATVRRASQRLSTEAADLRRRIRQAAGDTTIQPVANTGSRYHLHPDLLDIDLWRLTDALRHAATTTDLTARTAALGHAIDSHTGALAAGYDYDWIEAPREQLRRHGIRARLTLAALVADADPHTAAGLIQAAATLDPINEDLARQAMRALARTGDADAVREQYQRLRAALDELDLQPDHDTTQLAAELLRPTTDPRPPTRPPDQLSPPNRPPPPGTADPTHQANPTTRRPDDDLTRTTTMPPVPLLRRVRWAVRAARRHHLQPVDPTNPTGRTNDAQPNNPRLRGAGHRPAGEQVRRVLRRPDAGTETADKILRAAGITIIVGAIGAIFRDKLTAFANGLSVALGWSTAHTIPRGCVSVRTGPRRRPGSPREAGVRSPGPADAGRTCCRPMPILEDVVTTASADHLAGPGTRVADRVDDLDAGLRRAVRRTSAMRQLFYVVVLLVALAGQVSGAVQRLDIPLLWAVPAVAGLELGGVVVLANADVRRRLGERAIASRLLSALIAAAAVAFNWFAHTNRLLGAFFAGMSALGYLVWLMHTENQRRDGLRARGDLPPTTPAYEVVEHWLRHPALTLKAKSLAKADPRLGLYGSLDAARVETRRQRRQHAISVVLHRKIRAAVDPTVADIAVAVYDLDEIAARLADSADYDTLTALINADLAPARLTADISAHLHHRASAAEAPADQPPPPLTDAALNRQSVLDVPAGASPVNPAGTPPPPVPPAPVYEPASDEDAAMYQAWCTGVAAGQEPTGADLARAAGRPDDATGVGRRAARRYRDAHAASDATGHNGDRHAAWQPNGHKLTSTGTSS